MTASDINKAIARFEETHYPCCKRHDLVVIMLPSTLEAIIRECRDFFAVPAPFCTEGIRKQIFGLPVIVTTDIDQAFRIAWMPREGGAS